MSVESNIAAELSKLSVKELFERASAMSFYINGGHKKRLQDYGLGSFIVEVENGVDGLLTPTQVFKLDTNPVSSVETLGTDQESLFVKDFDKFLSVLVDELKNLTGNITSLSGKILNYRDQWEPEKLQQEIGLLKTAVATAEAFQRNIAVLLFLMRPFFQHCTNTLELPEREQEYKMASYRLDRVASEARNIISPPDESIAE